MMAGCLSVGRTAGPAGWGSPGGSDDAADDKDGGDDDVLVASTAINPARHAKPVMIAIFPLGL